MQKQTNQNPFHVFDIRGEYPKVVNEALFRKIADSLRIKYSPKKIVLGMDNRPSSPKLKQSLVESLLENGINVIDIGETTTPLFYFSVICESADLGLITTASHLPGKQNGIKIVKNGGIPLDEVELKDIEEITKKDLPVALNKKKTTIMTLNTREKYLESLIKLSGNIKHFKIVVDGRDKIVDNLAREFFRKLPLETLFIPVNDMKESASVNPLEEESQTAARKKVLEEKADLGIIFDGDGDRVVFLDKEGELIPLSYVLGFLGGYAAKFSTAGREVATDTRAGLVTRELIENSGGKVIVSRSWVQSLKFLMSSNQDICFSGETSGHFIFRDFFNIDDGLRAAIAFLSLMSKDYFNLENEIRRLKKSYFELPEENFRIEIEPSLLLDKIANFYRNDEKEVSLIDGVTVQGDDFHLNIRQSLSEPLVRLNIEAKSEARLKEIYERITSFVKGRT